MGNGLTDSIPAELGDLGALRVLDLSRNELAGPIPAELGDLARLTALRLQGNALTGPIPAELGDLSGLELLYLQENELTGAVPAELGGLSRLAELRLGSNGLTGAVPPELGGLGELELLFLDHNALTGAVPAELGDLGSLRTLLLQNNRLTGSIPSELGDLDSLLLLAMADNRLTGSIPPELGGLASLTQLLLQSNRLTGEIPLELGDLENLTHLFLSSNQLTGGIPGSLTRLRSLSDVDLRDNLLGGCVASALHRFKATINPQSGGSVVPDCRPRVDVYPTEGLETVEGGDSDFFWVLLEDSPSADVRIRLSSSDPGEGVMHQKELLFTPRDWYVRRIVGVYGVDDDIRDGPQEYTAVLDTLESTDPRWRGTDPADVRVTNLDNEPEGVPRINAFEAYPHTIPAGGETMLYWLVDRAASIRIEPGVGTVTEDSVPVRPEATTTYTLTAANFDGETMAEATVTVVSDVAVEAFRAVPDSVTRGEEARLEWEVEGAESVFIDGVDVTDSTYLAVAPEATTTYGLAAVNALGYAARLEWEVEWEVEDAHSVFVDGADVTDSTYLAVTPTEATTYELAAVNALGDSATAEVTVTVVPPPAVDTFRAVPDSVTRGEGARLEWAVEGADSVFIDGADVTDSTELAVAPEATTTYTLIAKNRVGGVTQTATAAATLTVVPPASVASFEATPDSVTRGEGARARVGGRGRGLGVHRRGRRDGQHVSGGGAGDDHDLHIGGGQRAGRQRDGRSDGDGGAARVDRVVRGGAGNDHAGRHGAARVGGRGRGVGVHRRGRRDGQHVPGGGAGGDDDLRAGGGERAGRQRDGRSDGDGGCQQSAGGARRDHRLRRGQLQLHVRRVGLDRPGRQHRVLWLGHGGRHDAGRRGGRTRLCRAGALHSDIDGDRQRGRDGHEGHGAGREPAAGGRLHRVVRGAGLHVHEHVDRRRRHRDLGVGLRGRRERLGLGRVPHLRGRRQLRGHPHGDRQPGGDGRHDPDDRGRGGAPRHRHVLGRARHDHAGRRRHPNLGSRGCRLGVHHSGLGQRDRQHRSSGRAGHHDDLHARRRQRRGRQRHGGSDCDCRAAARTVDLCEPNENPVGRRRPDQLDGGERPERGGRRGGGDGHQRLRGREPDADRALRDHGGGPAGPAGVG